MAEFLLRHIFYQKIDFNKTLTFFNYFKNKTTIKLSHNGNNRGDKMKKTFRIIKKTLVAIFFSVGLSFTVSAIIIRKYINIWR